VSGFFLPVRSRSFLQYWACCLVFVFQFGARIGTASPITALAFSPDGSALVSNGARRIDVRSPKDGSIQRSIACPMPKVTSIAFNRTGTLLTAAGGIPGVSGALMLFDWRGGKVLCQFTNQSDLATSVAFDATGSLLGAAGADHLGRVWKIEEAGSKLTEAFALKGHAGPVRSIAFSPTGKTVVTAGADRAIKVWSTSDGSLLRTFSHHTESVNTIVFRHGSTGENAPAMCASAADDHTVRIWQPEKGRMLRIIRQHQGPIFTLVFSPGGEALFSAGKEGIVRRLDPESDAVLAEWRAHDDWIYALAISSDGSRMATGDWNGKVRVWDDPWRQTAKGR